MNAFDHYTTIRSVKLVPIMSMPEDVREAYTIVSKNYSDQPSKGNAKEFYKAWIENDEVLGDKKGLIDLQEYSPEHIKNYLIVAKWFVSKGINMTDDEIFVHWDW